MDNKSSKYHSVCTRAEKLYKKRNYTLAKAEFEKAIQINPINAFAEQIEVCESEILLLKAKDLLKRARKHLKKNRYDQALACFEEANQFAAEPWIREKIDELRDKVEIRENSGLAEQAEETGDYLKAAERYQRIFDREGRAHHLSKKALCLVKAERYEEAISDYRKLDLSHQVDRYNYGFCLFKTKNFFETLRAWEDIPSNETEFLNQKEITYSLLFANLHTRFEKGQDCAAVYREIKYLSEHASLANLEEMVEHCKYAWIEKLWESGEHGKIAELLRPVPVAISSAQTQLCAKNSFKLFEQTREHPEEFVMFWLTFVYSQNPKAAPGSDEEMEQTVRQAMISAAEKIIEDHHVPTCDVTKKVSIIWDIEKKTIGDLAKLVGSVKASNHLVCTPLFAEQWQRTAEVLALIKANENYFRDRKHYLETGSLFTDARQSIYFLEMGEMNKALQALPEDGTSGEFTEYAVQRVRFAFGMHAIERGDDKCGRYFLSSLALLDLAPEFEQELVEKAGTYTEKDELGRYEKVLKQIHQKRSSEQIRKALSLTIGKRAIILLNEGFVNLRVTTRVLKNALVLYPENDMVSRFLMDMGPGYDIEALNKALDRYKFSKAAQIVLNSQSEEVEDYFFGYFENLIEAMEEYGVEISQKRALLTRCYECCKMVDDSHYITEKLGEELENY